MKTMATTKKPEKITLLMLAKDVLKWLKPGSKVKLVPKANHGYIGTTKQRGGDVQTYLKSGKPCTVCGIGALAAAAAFRKDELQFDGFGLVASSSLRRVCIQVTGLKPSQADYIEYAFEYEEGLDHPAKSAKGRLTQICENIVKNRGRFVRDGGAY